MFNIMSYIDELTQLQTSTGDFNVASAIALARYSVIQADATQTAKESASRLGEERLKGQLEECRDNLKVATKAEATSDIEGALKQMFVLAYQLEDADIMNEVIEDPHAQILIRQAGPAAI